ncbi:MAG: hypothetical protein MMC23_007899 [Stictis urceolatum]|nr:hypothetical protein [Stictis urceolata]
MAPMNILGQYSVPDFEKLRLLPESERPNQEVHFLGAACLLCNGFDSECKNSAPIAADTPLTNLPYFCNICRLKLIYVVARDFVPKMEQMLAELRAESGYLNQVYYNLLQELYVEGKGEDDMPEDLTSEIQSIREKLGNANKLQRLAVTEFKRLYTEEEDHLCWLQRNIFLIANNRYPMITTPDVGLHLSDSMRESRDARYSEGLFVAPSLFRRVVRRPGERNDSDEASEWSTYSNPNSSSADGSIRNFMHDSIRSGSSGENLFRLEGGSERMEEIVRSGQPEVFSWARLQGDL